MNGIPVVRLTVEGMEHSIIKALGEYELQLSEEIKRAVTDYCTPGNIQRVVGQAVAHSLDNTVREEVDRFYRYGRGRQMVRDAVIKKLSDEPRS